MTTPARLWEVIRPASVDAALHLLAEPGTMAIGGGTDLTTLILDGQRNPMRLVETTCLSALSGITVELDGLMRLGAATRLSAIAYHAAVRDGFPAISEALLAGATPQIRAMATLGGNLLQRTRCGYFRSPPTMPYACNKLAPGSGCAALVGENRGHAILGASNQCVATHPSDLAVALIAFDAVVELRGNRGRRSIPVASFFLRPGEAPDRDTAIELDELIESVVIRAIPAARRARYVKVRDRASYQFAVVSSVAGLDVDKTGRIREARCAAGGVGTIPWRLPGVEAALLGRFADERVFAEAAALAADDARPLEHNRFKVELLRRTVRRAIELSYKENDRGKL